MCKQAQCVVFCLASGLFGCAQSERSIGNLTPGRGGSFTIVTVPSSYENQDILQRQAKWIRENVDQMNTILVVHTGDITQDNTEAEWSRAEASMRQLDGVVPYVVLAGDHESFVKQGEHVGQRYTSVLNKHFGVSHYRDKSWYGGHLDNASDNMFLLLDADGMKFLVLALEFAPRDAVLEWANDVVREHADCRVIVVTHSFIYTPESQMNFKLNPLKYDQDNTDRDEMWEKFVSRHSNIFLVLSSHYFGVRRETSIGKNGNHVHQVMASYLDEEHKLDGWLRVIRLRPRRDKIEFRTYSPVLDKWLTDEANQFELAYPMGR